MNYYSTKSADYAFDGNKLFITPKDPRIVKMSVKMTSKLTVVKKEFVSSFYRDYSVDSDDYTEYTDKYIYKKFKENTKFERGWYIYLYRMNTTYNYDYVSCNFTLPTSTLNLRMYEEESTYRAYIDNSSDFDGVFLWGYGNLLSISSVNFTCYLKKLETFELDCNGEAFNEIDIEFYYGDGKHFDYDYLSYESFNDDSLTVNLYRRYSDNIVMYKTLIELGSTVGTFRGDVDVSDLVLTLTNVSVDFNYIFIPKLERYYYVNNIRYINNNLIEIDCHVDVLNSYKTYIDTLTGICERSSLKHVNRFIRDDYIVAESGSERTSYIIPNNNTGLVSGFDVSSNAIRYIVTFVSTGARPRNYNNIWGNGIEYLLVSNVGLQRILNIFTKGDFKISNIFSSEPGASVISVNMLPFDLDIIYQSAHLIVDAGVVSEGTYTVSFTMMDSSYSYSVVGIKEEDRISRAYRFNDTLFPIMQNVMEVAIFSKKFRSPISFLDYSPYTQCKLYLPFYGYVDIDSRWVYGGTLTITYKLDMITLKCAIEIYSTLYGYLNVFLCTMGSPVPYFYSNVNERGRNIVKGVANIALAVATKGKTLPLTAGSSITNTSTTVSYGKAGRKTVLKGVNTTKTTQRELPEYGTDYNQLANRIGSNTIDTLIHNVEQVVIADAYEDSLQMKQVSYVPILHSTTLKTYYPDGYEKAVGYPCGKKLRVSSTDSFTKFSSIYTQGDIKIPENERNEIEQFLKNGFSRLPFEF